MLASAGGWGLSLDDEDRNIIHLWEPDSGRLLRTFRGHSGSVISLAFDPIGNWIASGSADKTVKIWDIRTGQAVKTISGYHDDLFRVTFSPDGRWLAVGCVESGIIEVWDMARLLLAGPLVK